MDINFTFQLSKHIHFHGQTVEQASQLAHSEKQAQIEQKKALTSFLGKFLRSLF